MSLPITLAEKQRLAELQRLAILDTDAEDAYDRITRLAHRLFNVPTTLMTLVDEDRVWFKSQVGARISEHSRRQSFCHHAIQQDAIFEITEPALDARFSSNPMVLAKNGIRYYAGIPLRVQGRHNIGTLCVVDNKPHTPMEDTLRQCLSDLGKILTREIENRRAVRQALHLVSVGVA